SVPTVAHPLRTVRLTISPLYRATFIFDWSSSYFTTSLSNGSFVAIPLPEKLPHVQLLSSRWMAGAVLKDYDVSSVAALAARFGDVERHPSASHSAFGPSLS